MKFAELNPHWYSPESIPGSKGAGVVFDCPSCASRTFKRHTIFIPFVNPIVGESAGFGTTWSRTGTDFETLTITPSIRSLRESCGFHGFITAGEVQFCADSSRPDTERAMTSASPTPIPTAAIPKTEETGMRIYNTKEDAGKDMGAAIKIDPTAFIAQIFLNNRHQFAIRVGHDLWFAGDGVPPTKSKQSEQPAK